MKKIMFLLMPLAAVLSCSQASSDVYVPKAPVTLSVDKQEIESDGKQTAIFTVTDADGVVLTDNPEYMSKIYFKNEATGRRLAKGTKEFRSVEDGEYTFSATVSGEPCANTVTVTSSGRSRFEVFRKNVAIYRFTATWCQNCPSMTKGLDRVSDWTKGRIVELAFHGAGSTYAYSDGSKYVADYLIGVFKAPGFPSCVYDLDVMSSERNYSEIESIIFDRIASCPTSCGIKASSSYSAGSLSVSAQVKSSTGGRYDIGFAVLRDNCIPGGSAYEDVYNNVVVGVSGNYEVMSSSAFELLKDGESSSVTQSVKLEVPAGVSQDDYSVVVFALKQSGGDIVIDNIVSFPVNGSVDYAYN